MNHRSTWVTPEEAREALEKGSSFAAPHVSGVLSRLISQYPSLKPPVAKALLQEIAGPWLTAMRGPNH